MYNRGKIRFIFTGKKENGFFFVVFSSWESPEGHVTIAMSKPAEQINCVSI